MDVLLITWYTIKLTLLRDQDYSNMIIEERDPFFCSYDKIYHPQFIDMGGLECTTGHRKTDIHY